MGFIEDILKDWLYDLASAWAAQFVGLGRTVFYIEDGLASVLSTGVMNTLFAIMSAFAVSLLVLKVLKKGFWTYILWLDGDPDASIQQTVIRIIQATVAIIGFPVLYGWFADVSLWLIEKMTISSYDRLAADFASNIAAIIPNLIIFGSFGIIAAIIYFIMLFILYLQFIKRSAELLLLRLGFPLACLGLLDSDKGVFTTTAKSFIQVALTTACQLFCMTQSIAIFISSYSGSSYNDSAKLLYCIAFCMAAFSTPKTLQFILMQTGGGGMQKVTGTVHMATSIKSLIGK